jgi:predicted outer membrane repeat protein
LSLDDDDDPKPRKRFPFKIVVVTVGIITGLVLGALVIFAIVSIVTHRIVSNRPDEPRPTISVDENITELEFGQWNIVNGKDGLGRDGRWFKTTAKNVSKANVNSFNYDVTTFDYNGVKLSGGAIIFPELKPNETGEIQVRFDYAMKAVVSKRR